MSGQLGFTFQKDTVQKYQLDTRECLILQWLIWFMDSGSNDAIVTPDGVYYWVRYSKLISDLGDYIKIHNRVTAASVLNSLCRKGVLRKLDSGKNRIRRIYFRFSESIRDELYNGARGMNLIDAPKIEVPGIHQRVLELLSELDTLKIDGEKKLFSYNNPAESGKITKSIKRVNKMLLDIYFGKFLGRNYSLNSSFLKRNESSITKDSYERIKSCRGSWKTTTELVLTAAKNYVFWFKPNRQPLSKKWLTRDIASWFYDDHYESSLFLACISGPSPVVANQFSKMVIKKLPDNIYKAALQFKKEFFPNIYTDSLDFFWFAVNDVFKAENKLKKLYSDNYHIALWLEYSVEGEWTCKYLEYLKTCWGENTKKMLLPNHVGPKGKPWKKWFYNDENLADIADELYSVTIDTSYDD